MVPLMHFQFLFTDYFPESQENDRKRVIFIKFGRKHPIC